MLDSLLFDNRVYKESSSGVIINIHILHLYKTRRLHFVVAPVVQGRPVGLASNHISNDVFTLHPDIVLRVSVLKLFKALFQCTPVINLHFVIFDLTLFWLVYEYLNWFQPLYARSQYCEKRLLVSSRLFVCPSIHPSVRMEQLSFHWSNFHEISYLTMFLKSIQKIKISLRVRVKVKVPRIRLEGPEGGRGIALLFLNLGARRGWVVSTTPRPFYPRERPGTHCTGGWMGRRAGIDSCEKSRPYRDSIPGPFSP
jgi:hypothetical protein